MKVSVSLVILCLTLSTSMPLLAQTLWPSNVSHLNPGDSFNPFAALLPAESTAPTSPQAPPMRSHWTGRWSGYACRRACDVKLAISDVTSETAKIIVAFSSVTRELVVEKADAVFAADELHVRFRTAPSLMPAIALRLRADGDMEFVRVGVEDQAGGVLKKVEDFQRQGRSQPQHDFNGTWSLSSPGQDGKAGVTWDRRLRIDGPRGHLYRVNRQRENDAEQPCRNIEIPLEEVTVTDAFVTFMAIGSKVLTGCPDLRFVIERRGDAYGGAEQVVGPGFRATRGQFIAVRIGP